MKERAAKVFGFPYSFLPRQQIVSAMEEEERQERSSLQAVAANHESKP